MSKKTPNNNTDWFAQFGGYEIKSEPQKGFGVRMQEFSEIVLVASVPCLTILFVFFVYALVRLFYNYVKLFEARSKKKVSELKGPQIEDFEENH